MRKPSKLSNYTPKTDKTHLDKRASAIIASTPQEDDDALMTTAEVAAWLGVSRSWLEIGRLTACDARPPFVRVAPQTIRYRREAVLEWLKRREYASTAEYSRKAKAEA